MTLESNFSDSPFEEELDDIIVCCQRCGNYLSHATETICRHIFCRQCIEQYLLYFDECPICKLSLRRTTLYSNRPLDSVIHEYLRTEPQYFADHQRRLDSYKSFQSADRLGELKVGMKVDFRDIDYIWTTGVVFEILRSSSSPVAQALVIRYNSGWKQQIMICNNRIAPLGTFSTRNELPHYSKGKIVMERDGREYEFKQWKKAPESDQRKLYK